MNLVRILEQRADECEDCLAYRFLPNDREELCLTYGQLFEDVQHLADAIRRTVPPGQRVLLLYPAGLQFIRAFFACLSAKVVAVPLPLPRPNDAADRLGHVIKDCAPAAIFTDTGSREQVCSHLDDNYRTAVATTDGTFCCPGIRLSTDVAEDDVALLQYTSGSTSAPKGVVLRNANLVANLEQIALAFGHTRESCGVIWLPHYHDMGLIGGVLQPMFAGFPVTLFPPISFVQRPLRWLQAIHKYRATTSGGPNFAYELCVAKADALDAGIDLSCWKLAFNGAEPIRASTLDAFSRAFSKAGFQRSAFVPCYGLAEATLIVSAVPMKDEPRIIAATEPRITGKRFASPTRDRLVSCGPAVYEVRIQVLDVDTNQICSEGEVGEIVVQGPAVTSGYWALQAAAEFRRSPCGGFRTGDLGFMLDEELFVTGRISDIIIIRGKNVFPEDIEATVRVAQPMLAHEGAAAFAVEGTTTEELVLVQEISSRTLRVVDLNAMRDEVSRLVMQRHGIDVAVFIPVRAGSLMRTSSGKISRFACKQLYMTQQLRRLSPGRANLHQD